MSYRSEIAANIILYQLVAKLISGDWDMEQSKRDGKATIRRVFRSAPGNMPIIGIALFVALIITVIILLDASGDAIASVLRYTFIVLLSILPAVMYFVFIALKKTSLFQEYVSNLHQLGLIGHPSVNVDPENGSFTSEKFFLATRIQSYLKRFEAVYGPITNSLRNKLLAVTTSDTRTPLNSESASSTDDEIGQIFSPSTAIPVLMATALIFVGWFLYLAPEDKTGTEQSLSTVLNPNTSVVLFGFLGAYFFSLQMLYRRFVINDLRAKAYVSVSIRIVLAVIASWVLQSLPLSEEQQVAVVMPVLAFVVGFFPPVFWRYIRTVIGKFPLTRVPDFENKLPITELDGLTIWHQARLEEEDIENGFNMASAEIIQLMLNTKIPADRIIDWVDQAVLFSCVHYSLSDGENKVQSEFVRLKNRLQRLGIRTATMLDQFKGGNGFLRDDLNEVLEKRGFEAAEIVHLVGIAHAVENYPNLALVRSWKSSLRPLTEK